MRQDYRSERGAVLVFSLLLLVVLISLSGAVTLRSVFEMNLSRLAVSQAKADTISEAGAYAGLDGISNLINDYALNTVSSELPSTVVSKAQQYASSGQAIRFLCWALKNNGTSLYTCPGDLDPDPESLTYIQGATLIEMGQQSSGTFTYTIVIKEKNAPENVGGDIWDFNYIYSVSAQGQFGEVVGDTHITGDFTVRVQKDNFAKYALFTNAQKMANGTDVWFTSNTNFAGPIHTNDRYNIYGNPSGVFDGAVSQSQDRARFYNNGWTILLDADNNGTTDVPIFNSGFNRGVSSITFSSAIAKQDMIDQASNSTAYGSDGVYLPNSAGNLTGGIFVKGDAEVSMAVDGSDNARYTIQTDGVNHVVTVDLVNNQTLYNDGTATVTFNGIPNGVDGLGTIIYVDGEITDLGGTVQRDTQLTIASTKDIVIQDNILYQNYVPAWGDPGDAGYQPPSANGAENLLGIVTWDGDVVVGASAPDNVQIHGTILAQNDDDDAVLKVGNHDSGSPRGTATLLGGVITQRYGAFGLFNASTGQNTSGYGRNFVYDERMLVGNAPPYFPSLNTFVAFTNDITDKMVWQ